MGYHIMKGASKQCIVRLRRTIQTLTCLMKNSFHDRQLVLVNTARVLKFLESYAA